MKAFSLLSLNRCDSAVSTPYTFANLICAAIQIATTYNAPQK